MCDVALYIDILRLLFMSPTGSSPRNKNYGKRPSDIALKKDRHRKREIVLSEEFGIGKSIIHRLICADYTDVMTGISIYLINTGLKSSPFYSVYKHCTLYILLVYGITDKASVVPDWSGKTPVESSVSNACYLVKKNPPPHTKILIELLLWTAFRGL